MFYNEKNFEEYIINLFKKEKYEYRDSAQVKKMRKNIDNEVDLSEFCIFEDLKEFLFRTNDNMNEEFFKQIVRKLNDLNSTSNLFKRNKIGHGYLTNGIEIENDKNEVINFKLIDFENVKNNIFVITNQFRISNMDNELRIPDIVIYINGFPIVIWELKTPKNEINIYNDENNLINKAYNQVRNYKEQISYLFTYNFFNVISDGQTTKFGSTFSFFNRFVYWKRMSNDLRNGTIELFIEKLFRFNVLLDLFKNFTFFTDTKEDKIIASYHQYYGVKESIISIQNAIKNKTKKGGIVYHATGTGKSFSMIFLTKNFTNINPNSTVIIISDREDLDNQTYNNFLMAESFLFQKPKKILSIDNLILTLKEHKQNGIFFSTVQKFQEKKVGILSKRENILIITDEAHRSHNNLEIKQKIKSDKESKDFNVIESKSYALVLRESFPNATFIGYSGSPRDDENASTKKVFGNIISSYPMSRAIEDGFIVGLKYERRHEKLKITKDSEIAKLIDKNYNELCENLENEGLHGAIVRRKLNKELKKIENILSDPTRLKEIAKDFIELYNERKNILKGKVLFVCYNRKIGFEFYKTLIGIKPEFQKITKLIATHNSSDPEEMSKLLGSKKDKERWANEFKDENSDFKIAIVIDMWLTGFDNPCLDTLCIDKPIKMHNLIQTIARINRVYSEKIKDKNNNKIQGKIKENGVIIDYLGISNNLAKALKKYDEELILDEFNDNNINSTNLDELAHLLLQEVDRIYYDFLPTIKINFKSEQIEYEVLENISQILLDPKKYKSRDSYIKKVNKIKKEYNAIIHILSKEQKNKFLYLIHSSNNIINILTAQLKDKYEDKLKELKELLGKSIIHDEKLKITKLNEGKDIKLKDLLDLLGEKIKNKEQDNTKLSIVFSLLKINLEEYTKVNKNKSLSLIDEMNNLLDKYNQSYISFEDFINGLKYINNNLIELQEQDNKLNLNKHELIFFSIICENSSSNLISKKNKEQAIIIAKEVYDEINKKINDFGNKWFENQKFIKIIRVRIKDIMEKHQFPPEDCQIGAKEFVNKFIETTKEQGIINE